MHKLKILKPENHADFEVLCKHVYGIVFNCTTPKSYGRSGQKQYGIDVLIQKDDLQTPENRIGIQCKHVEKLSFDGKSGDSICNEVSKVDEGVKRGKVDISNLIIVTSIASDVNLIQKVAALSDKRSKEGLFTVEIEFWNEIENHICQNNELRQRYTNPDRFHQRLIDKAGVDFYNRRYSSVVETLSQYAENNEFSHAEKIQLLKLLSLSYAYLLQRDKAKRSVDLAYQLASDDNSVILTKLHILSLDNEDIDLYREFLEKLPESTDEDFLNELEFESAARLDVIPIFEELSEVLQNKYEVRLRYLLDANQKQDSLLFQRIYRLLSNEERDRPEIVLLRIQDSLQQQNTVLASELVKRYFTPRHKTLWQIEHIVIRDNIILMLFNIYLKNKDYPNALSLLREVEDESHILDDQLLYVYFDIATLTQNRDLFNEGKKKLFEGMDKYSIDMLLGITQVALKFKDLDLVDVIQKFILNHYSQVELDKFNLFVWLEDLQNDPDLFVKNIKSSSLLINPDFSVLHRLAIKLQSLKDENELIGKLFEQVIKVTNKTLSHYPKNLLFLPRVLDYFVMTEQYKEAYFFLKKQPETEYIKREIYALAIELNLLKEAKIYLDQILWQDMVNDDYLLINSLALAQKSLDWGLLEEIIRNKEKCGELSAQLWLIKLEKYEKYNKSLFLQVLRNLPNKIKGKDSELFAIANLEIKYGFEETGLHRVYPVIRNNLFNSEITMLYLMLLTTQQSLNIRQDLIKIERGVTVFYESSEGNKYSITIDFDGDFIDHQSFISPEDSFAEKLLGKTVGDTFFIDKLGDRDTYQITALESIYITLNKLGHDNIRKPNFSKDIRLMTANLDDIEATVINPLLEMSERREKKINMFFDVYSQHPVTLHVLAKGLGIEDKAFALIYEWSQKREYPLYSDYFGVTEEWQSNCYFRDAINQRPVKLNSGSTLVIDSLTFLELEKYSDLKILNLLKQQIIVSSHTLDIFYNWRYLLQNEISKFSFRSQNRKLVRYDHNSGWVIDKFNKIINFIENYCDIFPSYGNDDPTLLENYMTMTTSSSEEQAVIRLCHEKNAVLFSLDARLRLWVDAAFKINTISISEVLRDLESRRLIDSSCIESILISQILDNRCSLGSFDLFFYIKHMFTTQEKFLRIIMLVKELLKRATQNGWINSFWSSLSHELEDWLGNTAINDHIKFWLIADIWKDSENVSLYLFRKKYLKKYHVDDFFEIDINRFKLEIANGKTVVSYVPSI